MFLLYLAMEGAVRFLAAFITAETVPSLLVFLFFKYLIQPRNPLATPQRPSRGDAIERLADGRIRMHLPRSSGMEHQRYHGIDGQWFEVEREEQAHLRIRMLRSASLAAGKILRGYHEYDAAAY